MNKKIGCFGELLLRMSPALNRQWIHNASIPVYLGGAELNVATALAKWGIPVQYCTALPGNYLSQEICDELSSKQIDTSSVIFSGSRIGMYILAQGTDLKHGGVIYDRAYSSFSELQPGTIDWDEVLKDVSWFHFSAISPALNENVAAVCLEAVQAASAKNITVSVDLNYRAKLWQYGKQPVEVMPALVEYCDVVMGNIWSANSLLGIYVDEAIHDKKSKGAYLDHATTSAKSIMQKFPKCKAVANTFRFDNNDGLQYYATLNDAENQYVSKEYFTNTVIDKVGSGDCFMGGLIYGLSKERPLNDVVDFAAAAAFGKLQEFGDATSQTVEQIELLIH